VESIEIMKGAASLYGSVLQQVINITLKPEERKQLRERPMNIGTQTTADRTNIVQKTTIKGFLLMEI
jgi:hypothetical protein